MAIVAGVRTPFARSGTVLKDLKEATLVVLPGLGPLTLRMLEVASGELAPPLEHCLIGVNVGERHVFLLEPDQAFGSHNPQLTQRMARTALPPDSNPELHGLIQFAAPNGDKFTGIVRELDDEAVLVDFNHPLAGKPVRFEVQIIGIL